MTLLVWMLILIPPIDWIVATILTWLSIRYPGILTLRERAITAWILAFVATVAGFLGLVRIGAFAITNDLAIALLAGSLLLVSLPAIYWLLLLALGRFRMPHDDDPKGGAQ